MVSAADRDAGNRSPVVTEMLVIPVASEDSMLRCST
jgi:hypothetical protein